MVWVFNIGEDIRDGGFNIDSTAVKAGPWDEIVCSNDFHETTAWTEPRQQDCEQRVKLNIVSKIRKIHYLDIELPNQRKYRN